MFPWLQKLSIHTPRKVTGNSKGSGVPKGRGGGGGLNQRKPSVGKYGSFLEQHNYFNCVESGFTESEQRKQWNLLYFFGYKAHSAIRRTPNFATQSCKVFKLKISLKYSVTHPELWKKCFSSLLQSQLNSLILS